MALLRCLALAGVCVAVVGCNQEALQGPAQRGKTFFRQGQWKEAIDACSEALEDAPDSGVYICRGRSFQCLGDLNRAVHDFSYAIRFDPKNPEGYYYRALAYEAQGDKKRADIDRQMARELDPAYAEARLYMPQDVPFRLDRSDAGTPHAASPPSKLSLAEPPAAPGSELPHFAVGVLGEETGVRPAAPATKDVHGLPTKSILDRLLGPRTGQGGSPSIDDTRRPSLFESEPGAATGPESSNVAGGNPLSPFAGGASPGAGPLPSGSRLAPGPGGLSAPATGGPTGAKATGLTVPKAGGTTAQPAPRPFGTSKMRPTGVRSQPEE